MPARPDKTDSLSQRSLSTQDKLILRGFADWAVGQHTESSRGYLVGRGILPETIIRHRIGFVPAISEEAMALVPRGEYRNALIRFGILREDRPGHLTNPLAGRITLPAFDANGDVVHVQARAIFNVSKDKRYLGTATPKIPYGIYDPEIAVAPTVWTPESWLDALLIRQLGQAAIALAGSSLNDKYVALLAKKRIIHPNDADETGRRVVPILDKRLSKVGCHVVGYEPPAPYKDLGEMPPEERAAVVRSWSNEVMAPLASS